jgi:hypothetical protein
MKPNLGSVTCDSGQVDVNCAECLRFVDSNVNETLQMPLKTGKNTPHNGRHELRGT